MDPGEQPVISTSCEKSVIVSSHSRITALGLMVVLIWSTCFVVIKAGHADAPPLLFGALRALVAAAGLLAVARVTDV